MNIYKRIGLQLRTFGLHRVGGRQFFFQRNRILDQIKVVCKAGVEFDVIIQRDCRDTQQYMEATGSGTPGML